MSKSNFLTLQQNVLVSLKLKDGETSNEFESISDNFEKGSEIERRT